MRRAYEANARVQNCTTETHEIRSSNTLKSIEFIIVLPMRIGWMGRQKKRSPNFMLPLMTILHHLTLAMKCNLLSASRVMVFKT